MSYLSEGMQNLIDIGLVDVLLPFLLIFTIMYAILTKSEILGKKKNFNIAVAFVIALLVIVEGHVVQIMTSAIPNISIVVVAVVMFLIMVGLLGGKASWVGGSVSGWVTIISGAIVLYIFGVSAGWWGDGYSNVSWLRWLDNPQTMSTVIILLVFGIIVWFITKEDTPKKEEDKFFSKLGNMFSGKKPE